MTRHATAAFGKAHRQPATASNTGPQASKPTSTQRAPANRRITPIGPSRRARRSKPTTRPSIHWLTRPWLIRNTSIGEQTGRQLRKKIPVSAVCGLALARRFASAKPHADRISAKGALMRYLRLLCVRPSRKTWLAILALIAGGTIWFGYWRLGPSAASQPTLQPAVLIESLAPASEYTIHDAKVVDGGNAASASEHGKQDGPGTVDALDVGKAYERASRLAA